MQDNWFLAIVLVVLNSIFLFASTGALIFLYFTHRDYKNASEMNKVADEKLREAETKLAALNAQVNSHMPSHSQRHVPLQN